MKQAGDGTGKLVLYTQRDFSGDSHTFTASQAKINESPWKGKSIGSVVIQGNPWLMYPEESMKGVPVFLEEGRYSETESFEIPTCPTSLKFVQDDMNSPELYLASSTNFCDESNEEAPWIRADVNVQLLKYVSVGPGGIFAIKAKDESVWARFYESGGKPTSKVAMDTDKGDGWNRIANGTLRQMSVGTNSIWGVNHEGRVIVRLGISNESPMGREWATVDAETMKHTSVSSNGHVWAVDNKEKIWYRKGACTATILGTNWKSVSGSLKQVTVGHCGVWGINSDQCVYYRLNTYGDPDNEGTGWIKVEGKFQQIYSGAECVLALAGNRDIFYRANVFERDGVNMASNHEGTHWVRIEQPKETKIIFKQVECSVDNIWAVDKDNTIWYKEMSNPDENMLPHYNFTLYGDQPEFSMYKFPSRASTYKVNSGGWALYSEPQFTGKVMYHFGNELLSNDPPNKDNPYKSFFTQIASARPIRGQNFRTPIMRITMDWSRTERKSEKEILFSQEVRNEAEDYVDAPWIPTFDVETKYQHQFALKQAQNIAGCGTSMIRGCHFELDPIEPMSIPIDSGPDVLTGEEFQYQLTSPFIFKDELNASRIAKKTQVMKLPPLIPPRCIFKVEVCMYRGKFKAPFKADFKIGFSPNFAVGSESWHDSGMYEGVDESNVKLEVTCAKFPPPRKVSKMLNGLGDDM